jgi:sigma-B regulation protein RsbU (phosphoserine phosphatase)
VYDPSKRTLIYALAGHEPPRLKRCENGTMAALNAVGGLPLGVIEDETYERAEHVLRPGDQILFYTDGITEAQDPDGDMFGIERLDAVLTECRPGADPLIRAVLDALTGFTAGRPADDDRTLLVAKIT